MISLVLMVLGATVYGPEIRPCGLTTPTFVSDSAGIVTDGCGAVFITRDSGHTWSQTDSPLDSNFERNKTINGIALADGSLLLTGKLGMKMFRTANLGKTWSTVELPNGQENYELVARGAHVWAIGSAGKVLHSADFGKSWTVNQVTPVPFDVRAVSFDFVDEQHGWIAGWSGSLWRTGNGGASWEDLVLPDIFKPRIGGEHTIDRVVFVDEKLGFIHGERPGTWRTLDGGFTWERLWVVTGSTEIVRELAGNRRVLVTRDSADLPVEKWVIDLSAVLKPRGRGAVSTGAGRINLWEPDGSRTANPMTGSPGNETPNPSSVRIVNPKLRTAMSAHRAYISNDEGNSWRELPALPGNAPVRQFMLFDAHRGLASSGPEVFAYVEATWSPSTSPIDAYDLALAFGETPKDPFACLQQPSGRVELRFETHACFGGDLGTLDISWSPAGGEMNAHLDALSKNPVVVRKLSVAEVRSMLDELRARALRMETSSSCHSTTSFETNIVVSCSMKGSDVKQSFHFESDQCANGDMNAGVGGAASVETGERRAGYARAIAIKQWSMKLR